jgi:hypothetical protein
MDWTGFSDSTRTPDRKYVVASFRADANLSWVIDLRSFLNLPELKYRDFAPRRYQITSNPRLQSGLVQGLAEAELTIFDRTYYRASAYLDLKSRGAEFGVDFDLRSLDDLACNAAIEDSPFGIDFEEVGFGTPAMQRLRRLNGRFNPQPNSVDLRSQIGGKANDVDVLIGRAYSMLSPTEFREIRLLAAEPMLRSSFADNLERLRNLAHVFDAEHPKSLPLLNQLAGKLAEASGLPPMLAQRLTSEAPIREAVSTSSDHIQAADIAAGWASDILVSTNNDYRALARQVRWVTLNGIAIPTTDR